ncbi:MAG: hypothetical protein ACWA5R_10640 [bacterium]
MLREIVIYIHGVSDNHIGESHTPQYDSLHTGIGKKVDARLWGDIKPCHVEWGWNYDSQECATSHRLLSMAEANISKRVLDKLLPAKDSTGNPARLVLNPFRKTMLYGFADMFYYTSVYGKYSIRSSVAAQIESHLHKQGVDFDNDEVSLTLIGHSAGSVIAFDILFYLFGAGKDKVFFETKDKFAECVGEHFNNGKPPFEQLKALKDSGRLRVRRLVTLGSPISMMLCRSDYNVHMFAKGGSIEPKHYGLYDEPETFSKLKGARWINLWDKDDPIAFPVEPIVSHEKKGVVKDIYVDLSDRISKAHNEYWYSEKVYKVIASAW